MVRVEMLAVGKELLIGRTLNTNAHWVGKRLSMMGSMLKEVTTIDDDLAEIGAAFRGIIKRSPEFLVVVGGLGPTPDDMTLKGVANALGVGMKKNEKALRMMRERYEKWGLKNIELTPARMKMARLPVGSEPMLNEAGTAPGVRLVAGRTVIYCLPGVPVEMRNIFRKSIEPEVRKKLGKVHQKYNTLKLEGILESALAPIISRELKRYPLAYIKSHPRGIREGVSRIELDISLVGQDKDTTDRAGEAMAEEMTKAIADLGGRVVSVRAQRG